MRAIVQESYGSAAALELRDIAKPAFGETQVRVRVRTASFNAGDWYMMTGLPYLLRIGFGVRAPREKVPGNDVAGVVESVGGKVTRFRPGDCVFGACPGGLCGVRVRRRRRTSRPSRRASTFEQAAAVPVAGLTALQALRDQGRVQVGQRVLITGARRWSRFVRRSARQVVRRRGHWASAALARPNSSGPSALTMCGTTRGTTFPPVARVST